MSDFTFLNIHRVVNEDQDNGLDTVFYPVTDKEIASLEVEIQSKLPTELVDFYSQVGYGFIRKKSGNINRFMDTYSLQDINLRTGDFEYDPDLEIYDEIYNDDKLLFFEVNEGVYLAIDKIEHNEKNAIYYFGNKIANSLEEFIHKILEKPNFLNEY